MIFVRRASVFKNVIKNFSTDVNIVSSKGRQIEIPKISLHELVWQNLDKWPNKTAITCFETQRSYTFQELYKKSASVSRFLRESLKLKKSETVAVILPNVPEFPVALLGAIQAGLKVTTCNPNYTADEIKKQLEDAKPKVVFTTRELLPNVRQAISYTKNNIPIVEVTDKDGFSENVISLKEISSGEGCPPVDVNLDDTVILPYSSGTTGLPKGVQLSHFNLVANLSQVTSPEFAYIQSHEDVVPAFLPFFHIYGLVILLMHSIMLGAEIVAMPKFNADNFVRVLKKYKPTVLYSVPLVVLMANNNPNIRTEDLTCIRNFVSGAAPLGSSDVERFRSKTNNKVNLVQAYGMTETSPVTLLQTSSLENGIKIGGSGLLVPNTDAKILPIDGSSSIDGLGPNQAGELAIKGPQVMKGYFNNPQANEEIFFGNGWLKTGDIAYYDEDGHFYIKERLKELIKVKGFQVAPAELEEVLRNHASVEDVAVVGVPHPAYGEVPKAFVVVKSGQKVDFSQLEEFVAARVAKYKHLVGGVTFIDAIPKNPSGKILRRELRKLL